MVASRPSRDFPSLAEETGEQGEEKKIQELRPNTQGIPGAGGMGDIEDLLGL